MHEMSVALSIIDIAEKAAKEENAVKINEIELEIGNLSGVEISALEFAFETAVENTMLESARVKINFIEAEGRCGECKDIFKMENIFDVCPFCDAFGIELLKGKELKLKSINID